MPRLTAEQKREETRSRLLNAATTIFLSRGYQAAFLEEIGDLAGYSTGAIYSNYSNKEALFLACLDRLFNQQIVRWEEFFARVKEQGAEPNELGATLMAVMPEQRWRRAVAEFRVAATSDESRHKLLEIQHRWRDIVTQMLDVFCSTVGATPQLPMEVLAEAVTALANGLNTNSLIDPDLDVAGVFSATVSVLVNANEIATPKVAR
jgi:AcrR family transcriptional regulator